MPNNSVSDILSARVSLMLSSSVFYSAFYFLEINIQYNVVLPAAILLKANYIDVTLPHSCMPPSYNHYITFYRLFELLHSLSPAYLKESMPLRL